MTSVVRHPARHDSALKHTTGQALYIDDMPEPPGTLHAALVLSPVASGRLRKLDLATAAAMPGVVAVLGPDDVPGTNDVSASGRGGEPLFAIDRVEFAGQTLAMIVAVSLDAARHAAERVVIEVEADEPILDIETALAREAYVQAPATIRRGEPEQVLASAPHKLSAEFRVGGQEHFYLEGQIAFALPGEDGDMIVHSSTQHPTEVQHICAHLLGCDFCAGLAPELGAPRARRSSPDETRVPVRPSCRYSMRIAPGRGTPGDLTAADDNPAIPSCV